MAITITKKTIPPTTPPTIGPMGVGTGTVMKLLCVKEYQTNFHLNLTVMKGQT